MILGQDVFHLIRPLKYFESDPKKVPNVVRIQLRWVLSRSLLSTSGLVPTCFKAVTQSESDSKLADQLRSWYGMESSAATKQVDPRFAADARASKLLHIMTDANIRSVCCGPTTRVVSRTTTFQLPCN